MRHRDTLQNLQFKQLCSQLALSLNMTLESSPSKNNDIKTVTRVIKESDRITLAKSWQKK